MSPLIVIIVIILVVILLGMLLDKIVWAVGIKLMIAIAVIGALIYFLLGYID